MLQFTNAGTGRAALKHESLLKIMPRMVPADMVLDASPSPRTKQRNLQLECLGHWFLVRTKPDGACFFRAVAMALCARAGMQACMLEDNDAQAEEMRAGVVQESRLWVRSLDPGRLQEVEHIVASELEDDPTWDQSTAVTWERFHADMSRNTVFATYYSVSAWVKWQGIGIQVFQAHVWQCSS